MKRYLWLAILALMISCNGNKKQVVFLGDSITQNAVINSEEFKGFITLMQSEVDENIKLIGKGISGDKVSDLLARYKKDVLELNPDIVFIYIGINDVWHKYDFGTGSDIDLYEKGLRTIIADVKNQGAKVILCTPTVIGENSGEFRLGNKFKDVETMEKMDEDLDAFSDIIRNLSSEFNTELVDLRKVFKNYISKNNPENKAKGILTSDGVHLNNQGSQLIAENMLDYIN